MAQPKTTEKGQVPLENGDAKTATMMMFDQEQPRFEFKPLGVRDILNGSPVFENAWQFGYMPNLCTANLSPYGIGCFKVWSMGEVNVVMASLDELGKQTSYGNLDQMRVGLLETPPSGVKKLIEEGVTFYVASVKPGFILYPAVVISSVRY